MGLCYCSVFCCTLLYVQSSIAIILMGKRELVALPKLSSWCLVMVKLLFLAVPWDCLRFVIVVFPDHTHLLFFLYQIYKLWAWTSIARTLMAHSPLKFLWLWELYVAHGHCSSIPMSPKILCSLSSTLCALHEIWTQIKIHVYTSLKMWTDNDNRPSIYSSSYLTWSFDSGELKQCDQNLLWLK